MQGKASAAAAPCASCHRIQGTPAAGAVGPDLSFFGSRNTLGAGIWEGKEREAHIQPWIKNCPSRQARLPDAPLREAQRHRSGQT